MPSLNTILEREPQIIQLPQQPSTGAILGAGLGQGLAQLLQGLAQGRAQKMQQEQIQKQNQAVVNSLSSLFGEQQQEGVPTPSQISPEDANTLLGLLQQNQQFTPKSDEFTPIQWQEGYERINPKTGKLEKKKAGYEPTLGEMKSGEFAPLKYSEEEGKLVPIEKEKFEQFGYNNPGKVIPMNTDLVKDMIKKSQAAENFIAKDAAKERKLDPNLSAEDAYKIAQLKMKKDVESDKKISEKWKMHEKEIAEISKGARAAKERLATIEEMERLEKEGKLNAPGAYEFYARAGLPVDALIDPSSSEYKTLALTFMRDAKSLFGSRILEREFRSLMEMIPGLGMTPEGRMRSAAVLKKMYKANIAYMDAVKQVLKENNNVPPYDFQVQIDDKIGPYLDKVAASFEKDMNEIKRMNLPRPNRLGTIGQAVTGSVIGAPGKVLSGLGGAMQGIGALSALL